MDWVAMHRAPFERVVAICLEEKKTATRFRRMSEYIRSGKETGARLAIVYAIDSLRLPGKLRDGRTASSCI